MPNQEYQLASLIISIIILIIVIILIIIVCYTYNSNNNSNNNNNNNTRPQIQPRAAALAGAYMYNKKNNFEYAKVEQKKDPGACHPRGSSISCGGGKRGTSKCCGVPDYANCSIDCNPGSCFAGKCITK